MAARRCTPCDINYPTNKKECLVCYAPTWELTKEDWHDQDWEKKAAAMQNRARPGRPRPDSSAPTVLKGGHLFVADALLQESGYLDISVGDVVLIRGTYYEVDGPIYGGTDIASWWISKVEEEVIDWPTVSEEEYDRIQERQEEAFPAQGTTEGE